MTRDRKEYSKAWKAAHRESEKAKLKAWYESHKEEAKAKMKAYSQSHKEEAKARKNADVNANGQKKSSIRSKSNHYLRKYCTKIPGYEIHHCCTYTEPYKFIYCSREMHKLIHAYLRQHNISADSDHYEYIKHLLDDTVVLYGLE